MKSQHWVGASQPMDAGLGHRTTYNPPLQPCPSYDVVEQVDILFPCPQARYPSNRPTRPPHPTSPGPLEAGLCRPKQKRRKTGPLTTGSFWASRGGQSHAIAADKTSTSIIISSTWQACEREPRQSAKGLFIFPTVLVLPRCPQ